MMVPGGLGRSFSHPALTVERHNPCPRGGIGIIYHKLIFLEISRLSEYCRSLSFNMKLREYQTEVLDKIRQHQSTVAFMPTGSGKTLVAVRLLDERVEVQMHRQREGELRKACIFTAPNKVLCHQQAKYIEEHLRQEEPRVLVLTGEVKETVAWEEKEWAAALRESSVVVCVPEVLRRAMESGFVRGDWIDTLIFDECHHCVSKNGTNSGHAYCHLAQLAKGAERFVGLTASPLNCKRVDVEENLKQLKKVLALGGECEVVRPTVNEEELGQWVFAPQLEFKYFQPSQYPPQCKRFFQECGADPGRVHKFICNAYHRVSWLEEYYSLRRSITTLGKDAADFGMPPITLRPNERDLPLHVLSYYCEMLGQMGKILHECGTRTAAHALEFICRASTDDIDECTIPEAYNKAKTTISLDRLQRRVERLKEFCRENAEADLFDQPVVDAVRTSLWEVCMAILVDANLEDFFQGKDAPLGKPLEELKRWIREMLIPSLLDNGGDGDKLLEMGELLYLADESGPPDYNAAIVFVSERLMARAIAATLGCPYCVSGRDESASEQADAIERFKDMAESKEEAAVLIATSVCDEGVDVPVCDRVILWDMPPNVRCYIQRRGRARSVNPPSRLFLMVDEREEFATKARASVADFESKEQQMARLVDFWIQADTDEDDSDGIDAGIDPAVVIGRDGVRISCRRAKAVLFAFCSTLRSTDEFFLPEPWIFTESDQGTGRCRAVVILPSSVNPPSARWAMSQWQPLESGAVREACARQLVKLVPLPWVTPQFRNRYGPNKKILSSSDEDGVSEELLELARRSLSTRLPRPPSAFKKPWRDVNILYAYSLSAQWDSSSVSVPPRRQARYDKTRQRATAVNKLMLLTPGPLDLAVCHAVGHIPLSASGLGRSDSSMGTMQISLNPYHQHGGSSGAVEVDLALMNTLWGFHREIFSAGEVPCVDWHECEEGQEFWMMVPDMEVDRSEFDGVLAAFKDDSRLLLDFARTVCELSRMTQSYNLLALPPLSPRVLYEVLTPKRCHAMVDSERYEALGSSVLQLVASEYVWSQQFSAGEASLEGKLTDDRQEIISHSRTSQKAIDGGILDLIHSAAETGTSLTQEVLVSIANAARSCLLALVGALCDVHGIEAAVQATTKFQLVPNLPSRGLIAHGSPGEERDMDDWQLPKDFPPHLRERLRNPPVTYDTLTGAVQDSPSEIGGYVFGKHPWLLSESLTHASVTAVSAAYSNERLEWLGDAVLGAVVLRRLFQHQEPPRQLVKAFTDNVCNANLAKVAVERLDVHKRFNTFSTPLLGAIRRFVRELSSGRATVRRGPKPLADCVEAILGAVWIDAGGLADGGWAAAWDFVTSNIVVAPDRALSVEVVDLTSSPSQDEPSSPVLAECSATETIPPKELGLKRPAPASPNSSAKRRASESVNSEEDAVALREQLARLANTLNAEQLRRVVDVIESEIAPRGST